MKINHKKIIINYTLLSILLWSIWLIYRHFETKKLIGTGIYLIEVNIWFVLIIMLSIGVIGGYLVECFSNKRK